MKKLILSLIVMLTVPMAISAQAVGGQITRKKTNTTATTPAKKTQGSSSASNKTGSGKRSSASASSTKRNSTGISQERKDPIDQSTRTSTGKSQDQKDRVIQNLISNMIYVQGGTFTMGATLDQGSEPWADDKPAHQVTLPSFSIGRYEVTQEEWEAVMGNNPSYFKGAKRPVERVSWDDCQEFIRKLNALTGKHFRLPTEAEWEFAARGGYRSKGYKYAGGYSYSLDNVAWYVGNSNETTHEVGEKTPNELGLYDMTGNVWEWCQDWYSDYSSKAQTTPTGPTSGSHRVNRGGSWLSNGNCCCVAYRFRTTPSYAASHLGLRLAF